MKFAQFAGFWTLLHHPSRSREWSLDRKLRTIKQAGFTGVSGRLDDAIASVAAQRGLFTIGQIFPATAAEFLPLLQVQKQLGAHEVTVEFGTHDTSATDAVNGWIRLETEARRLGLTVSLETHRDTVTETPEKVFDLADRYEKRTGRILRLTWDFSHLGVVKHLRTGQFVERLLARPELIQNATLFHFRPFSSHHAQVPVTYKGKLTAEVIDYLDFAQEVMHLWKVAPANKQRTLYGCPALGPKGSYALTNFPPVWPDALVLSSELNKRWQQAR